ncbi:hypothetical protein CEUSTIGMA_g942.t1 [Chlamydomonas eustigma]|uniref:Mitochondrial carrier protein n=1 Tax=Chlamydomonas eustigma TaxID=1157962 RepID=A0A250WSH1_9CHLO|nr:hypothetical protein CEUSTIGMA_g942.t1 [Chlamydomonas eustigma]|eukprot:GAX73490.1 hypothetical protein CEUSTIGMA_g942.t1 [Chlamydomonas eustigma]
MIPASIEGHRAAYMTQSTSTSASEPKYDGLDFVDHMIAGAVAGTVEHTAMYPIDTIKTRMQALSQPGQRLHMSMREALRIALRREGVSGLYKGVGAVAAGAGPAHAMHFAVYELAKESFGGNVGGGHHPAIAALSGALATITTEGMMTPVDVVKQRLQMAHTPYQNVLDCVAKTFRAEGISAFFKSYSTTLVMSIPFQLLYFSVYEGTKKVLLEPVLWRHGSRNSSELKTVQQKAVTQRHHAPSFSVKPPILSPSEEDLDEAMEDSLSTQLLAGGLAGGVAAAVTTPFDVVKTRLQTQGVHSATQYGSTSVISVMSRIYQDEGMSALWRGLRPRVLFHVPAAAICWGTYESLKTFLSSRD